MTDQINTGGAAFPCENSSFADFNEGMTLRDYFAAKAMQGVLARLDVHFRDSDEYIKQVAGEHISKAAYAMADAMIAARGGAL